jgi:single-stranded DNA-specific DHH superfamily exonuclease
VKRDIALLERTQASAGDVVTVLDLSLDRNRAPLVALLERGVRVRYFDHHYAGALPSHPGLEALIDTSADTCTSLLVDRHLQGRFRVWAVVAAFGDNLDETARRLGAALGLVAGDLEKLRDLGESLNYNAYGESEADLLIAPAALYRLLARYEDPLRFLAGEDVGARLDAQRRADLGAALSVAPLRTGAHAAVYVLPNAPWSRRVIGEFANHLVRERTGRACVVIAPRTTGGYIVSVRAPADSASSADAFCRQFPTGGGRRDAAGIDHLPAERLEEFLERFGRAFP